MYGGNGAGKVRKGGNNGCVMKKETGRMRERERERSEGVLDEGYSSYLLYLLRLFTAGLSPSLPPSFHLSDRQLLADSLCCCSLRPESPRFNPSPPFLHLLPNMLLYFTSLLPPPPSPPTPSSAWKNLQFSASYSGGQKVKRSSVWVTREHQ